MKSKIWLLGELYERTQKYLLHLFDVLETILCENYFLNYCLTSVCTPVTQIFNDLITSWDILGVMRNRIRLAVIKDHLTRHNSKFETLFPVVRSNSTQSKILFCLSHFLTLSRRSLFILCTQIVPNRTNPTVHLSFDCFNQMVQDSFLNSQPNTDFINTSFDYW